MKQSRILMLDLEMTGLDPVKDEIIEVACFVVEGATLERVPGTELCLAVMPEDPKILDKMDDWNTRTHSESGLIRRVREEGVPIGEADQRSVGDVPNGRPVGAPRSTVGLPPGVQPPLEHHCRGDHVDHRPALRSPKVLLT